MISNEDHKDLQTIFPVLNTTAKVRGCVIAVTTASARTDVAALIPEIAAGGNLDGQYFDVTADGANVYLAQTNADAGAIDEAVTGAGATVAAGVVFNGTKVPYKFTSGYTWLIHKGSAAGFLRIALSSISQNQKLGTSSEDV
jgi:hypothetical protein